MKDAALWLNDAILLGTLILVWRYVAATNKLVKNSQQQLKTSEDIIRISQQQVESQSLPALVVKEVGEGIDLVNIGNGPAMTIECRRKTSGSVPVFSESGDPGDAYSYLEARVAKSTRFRPHMLVGMELHCLYRSISGRRYVSVSRFTEKGIFETHFHAE